MRPGDYVRTGRNVAAQVYGKLPRKLKGWLGARWLKEVVYLPTAVIAVAVVTPAKYANDLLRKFAPEQLLSQSELARCLDETCQSLMKLAKPHPPPFKRSDLMDNLVDEHDARMVYSASHTAAEFLYDIPLAEKIYGAIFKLFGYPITPPISLAPTLAHDVLNIAVVPYCKEGGKMDQYNQAFRAAIVCFNNFFLEQERDSVIRHLKKPSKRKRVKLGEMYSWFCYNWFGHERKTHWCPLVEGYRTAVDWHTKIVWNTKKVGRGNLEDRVATA